MLVIIDSVDGWGIGFLLCNPTQIGIFPLNYVKAFKN